ncbi:MAG: DUF1844 domain-containing protein [Phycisphaerae bacterium]|nr:DUF1844 domain-containing protein [Phycisphaerae bacterium]
MAEEERKLQVDDDWKSEAAAEKERLSKTVDAEEKVPLLDANFASLVQLIAMQAMVGLGGFAGPGGQQIPPNIDAAKLHIDMLDVLEVKTKGNLDAEEARLLNTTLHQLRMAYVDTVQNGGIPPSSAPSPSA